MVLYTLQVFFWMIHHIWRIRVSGVGVERGTGLSCFVSSVYFVLWSFPSISSVFLLFLLFSFLCSSSSSSPCQPQLGNLLQVNRTLGRNVPLASQLILMPNGAVAAVQQEVPSAQSPGVHTDADQVSGNHLTCVWMGTGEDEGNYHGPGHTLLAHYHFAEFFFFPPLFLISLELESLTTLELGRKVDLTEDSPVNLGSLILNRG